MITLYLWNERGLYVGSVEVEESGPLPERSTPTAPPELSGSECAMWAGAGWEIIPHAPLDPEPEPEPTPDWPALIASTRYDHEIAGFAWNECWIDTSRDSQAKINASWTAATAGIRNDGSFWKCLNVHTGEVMSIPMSNDEMTLLGEAAYHYVQGCYDREGDLLDAVNSGTFEESMLNEGWP